MFLVAVLISVCAIAQTKAVRKVPVKKVSMASVKMPFDTVMVTKAKSGNAYAQAYVGKCYFLGEDGVKENNYEAVKWFQKAVAQNSPYGYYWMALCLQEGYGIGRNAPKSEIYRNRAFKAIQKLANEGDANAQYYLAICYEDGNNPSGEENNEKAIKWYEKAAEQGHCEALCDGANCYSHIYGENCRGTFEFYKKAMELNNPKGMVAFARYYEEGIGVEKSLEKAYVLYEKAAKKGNPIAKFKLAKCYEEGNGVTTNFDKALQLYKEAAKDNVGGALYILGCYYRDGYRVDRNFDLALKYLTLASKVEDDEEGDAHEDLKSLRKHGRSFYEKQPKRCAEDIYDLKSDDPFAKMTLSANWDELSDEIKTLTIKRFKKEKIREWGVERATQVANHLVEIGFTSEQILYSQGYRYKVHVTKTPWGNVNAMIYDHCIYYLVNDKLIAMLWGNGVQVGDLKVIQSCNGTTLVTTGNE